MSGIMSTESQYTGRTSGRTACYDPQITLHTFRLKNIADNSQTLWEAFSIEDILVLVGSNFTEMSHKSIV